VNRRTAIVLQARMGSTRLPGKVLAPLGDRTVLAHCLLRLDMSGLPIIVATTERPEDDAVDAAAREAGVEVFRGQTDDVLGRYVGVARAYGLDEIVRATADNPLVDPDATPRVLELRRRVNADHAVESGLPIGCAVEAVSARALIESDRTIVDPYDREHVTSFVRRYARFRALRAVAPGHLRRPGLRLTVDTSDDLAFVRTVLAATGSSPMPPLADVIRVADELLVRSATRTQSRQGA
jgi:spore coat polysaccharide biosynthesis protein SpsF (cytidylyltransferase family)